jgi:hypothetical protein
MHKELVATCHNVYCEEDVFGKDERRNPPFTFLGGFQTFSKKVVQNSAFGTPESILTTWIFKVVSPPHNSSSLGNKSIPRSKFTRYVPAGLAESTCHAQGLLVLPAASAAFFSVFIARDKFVFG